MWPKKSISVKLWYPWHWQTEFLHLICIIHDEQKTFLKPKGSTSPHFDTSRSCLAQICCFLFHISEPDCWWAPGVDDENVDWWEVSITDPQLSACIRPNCNYLQLRVLMKRNLYQKVYKSSKRDENSVSKYWDSYVIPGGTFDAFFRWHEHCTFSTRSVFAQPSWTVSRCINAASLLMIVRLLNNLHGWCEVSVVSAVRQLSPGRLKWGLGWKFWAVQH